MKNPLRARAAMRIAALVCALSIALVIFPPLELLLSHDHEHGHEEYFDCEICAHFQKTENKQIIASIKCESFIYAGAELELPRTPLALIISQTPIILKVRLND